MPPCRRPSESAEGGGRRSKPRASTQAAPSAGKARRSAGATTPRQRATAAPTVTAATCTDRQPLCLSNVWVPTSLAPGGGGGGGGLRMDVEIVPNPAIDATIQAAVQDDDAADAAENGRDTSTRRSGVSVLERQIRRYFQLQRTLAMEPPSCPPTMALEGACEVALRQPVAQAAILAKLSHAAGAAPGSLVARIPRRDLVRWQQNWRAAVGSTPRAKMLAQLRDCMLTTPPATATTRPKASSSAAPPAAAATPAVAVATAMRDASIACASTPAPTSSA